MASVVKRPQGGYQVRYIDPATGKRPARTFEMKKDADAFRRKVEREIEDGTHVARGSSLPLADAYAEYLAGLDRRLREGTYRAASYRKAESHFRIHIIPALGTRRVVDITEQEADEFFAALRDKGLATESVAAIMAALSRLLDYAVRKRWVRVNVARLVRAWPENRLPAPEKVRTFDTDEAERLYRYFLDPIGHNPKWSRRYAAMGRCIVFLGLFCGLRSGEIRGVAWRAIDFAGGTLAVTQQVDEARKIAPTKTRESVRVVPLPRLVLAELEAWRAFAKDNAAGLVFTTKQGRSISPQDLHNHIWKRALIDLGYAPDEAGRWPHFHALRHFAASMMQSHIAIGDVSAILGHKSARTTLGVYTGSTMTLPARRLAIENMAAAILPVTREDVPP